jgi:16S rRNA processing protein RimM
VSIPDNDLYAVGTVVKPFGVKGEVVIQPLTDSAARFRSLHRVLVGRTADTAREATLATTDVRPGGVRATLSLCTDRTAAEALVGCYVFVAPGERAKLPKGTYFTHQVVGLTAVAEDGEVLGTVREVMKLPANDVYVIDGKGREILVPAVREFVRGIDPEAGTIRVRLIEGMDTP